MIIKSRDCKTKAVYYRRGDKTKTPLSGKERNKLEIFDMCVIVSFRIPTQDGKYQDIEMDCVDSLFGYRLYRDELKKYTERHNKRKMQKLFNKGNMFLCEAFHKTLGRSA